MRALILAFALAALAGCGPHPGSGGQTTGTAATPGQAMPSNGRVTLSGVGELPDWLLVAHINDCLDGPIETCRGDVYFNQHSITRNADGTADIWVQVRHAQNQLWQIEGASTRTTIQYKVERFHYRFKCAVNQFAIVEQQIMGANDTKVTGSVMPEIWRAPVEGSLVPQIQPIACRGS